MARSEMLWVVHSRLANKQRRSYTPNCIFLEWFCLVSICGAQSRDCLSRMDTRGSPILRYTYSKWSGPITAVFPYLGSKDISGARHPHNMSTHIVDRSLVCLYHCNSCTPRLPIRRSFDRGPCLYWLFQQLSLACSTLPWLVSHQNDVIDHCSNRSLSGKPSRGKLTARQRTHQILNTGSRRAIR